MVEPCPLAAGLARVQGSVDTIGTLRDADPEREQVEGVVVVWEAAFGLSADVLVAGVISVASKRDRPAR